MKEPYMQRYNAISIPPYGGSWTSIPRHPIDNASWADRFPYVPSVHFQAGWSASAIHLRYSVVEREIRAVHTVDNAPVWEDSCVEFFWAPDTAGDRHYAFEFNPAGACLAEHWKDEIKEPLATALMQTIRRVPRIDEAIPGTWDIEIDIPFSVFQSEDQLLWKEGADLRVNFYKCGDRHTVPHYIAWNPVRTSVPRFHCPDNFGIIKLNPS